MNCEEITQKISALAINKISLDQIESNRDFASLPALKREIEDTFLEILPAINSYEAQISHRKLVAEKHGFEQVSEFHEKYGLG